MYWLLNYLSIYLSVCPLGLLVYRDGDSWCYIYRELNHLRRQQQRERPKRQIDSKSTAGQRRETSQYDVLWGPRTNNTHLRGIVFFFLH